MSVYLIWSDHGGSWWRENGRGYTRDIWNAGRFDYAEARKACAMRTWSVAAPPPEVMVLAPEDGREFFTVDDIRAVPDLMRRRITDATEEALARRVAGEPQ